MQVTLIPALLAIFAGVALLVAIVAFVVVPIFGLIGRFVGRCCRFALAETGEVFRFLGVVLTSLCYVPLVLFSTIAGRWSRAQHYGRALQAELGAGLSCLYRMAIGHPLRLFGAQQIVQGLEERLPQAIANAPPGTAAEMRREAMQINMAAPSRGTPASAGRGGQFPGYQVIGTLPGGGSGAKLYVARPDERKLQAFARQAIGPVGDVVIKSFSLAQGSSLPQIVRENHALAAAKKLGLVLEHELNNERFFYVMRYVPGDSLGIVTQRLHAASSAAGLEGKELSSAIGYACDLLGTLHEYHRSGLWHKDVKPDNVIVAGGHAHLVDFGLVTPLRSSMTLTTHGTEYFRDPEMVRLALRGVKVHEVDGAKFDIFAVGAVLFSTLENSFPAHGGLSQITKSCPEALRWIVRRAMTDYDKRYPSAQAMLADLAIVAQAAQAGTLATLRPADLPSVKAGELGESVALAGLPGVIGPDAMATPLPHAPPPPPVGRWHGVPLAGTMAAIPVDRAAGIDFLGSPVPPRVNPPGPRGRPRPAGGRSAADQLAAARGRVQEMRRRAANRLGRQARVRTGANYGVAIVTLLVVMGAAGGLGALAMLTSSGRVSVPIARIEEGGQRIEIYSDGRTMITQTTGEDGVMDPVDPADPLDPVDPEAPDAPAAPEAPEPPAPPTGAPAARNRPGMTGHIGLSWPSSAGSQPARMIASEPLKQATVLVMQEPLGSNTQAQKLQQRLAETLKTQGARVLLTGEGDSSAATELESNLRVAVGLKPLDSPDAARAVFEWFNTHPSEVTAVVWTMPDPKSPGKSKVKIFNRKDSPKELTAALTAAVRKARK